MSFIRPFLLATLLTFLFFIFYNLIKPDNSQSVGFTPLPNVTPGSIIPTSTDSLCNSTPTVCDPNGNDCEKCGQGFNCQLVEKDKNVLYNGTVLKPNNYYCLPSVNINNLENCGTYTGRAVWSDDSSSEGWKCVCLYPSLFDGDDCMNNKACITYDSSGNAIVPPQPNRLVMKSNPNVVWDPTQPPPNNLSPYATDENGEPIFTCNCNPNFNLTLLPNDPYRCHVSPCLPSIPPGNDNPGVSFDLQAKTCVCGVSSDEKGRYVQSNVDGMCRLSQACIDQNCGSWDDTKNICNSPVDPKNPTATLCSFPCNSFLYDRTKEGVDRKCSDNYNAVGYECIGNPCTPGICGKGTCVVNCNNPPTYYTCDCPYETTGPNCTPCSGSGDSCQHNWDCCSGTCQVFSSGFGPPTLTCK